MSGSDVNKSHEEANPDKSETSGSMDIKKPNSNSLEINVRAKIRKCATVFTVVVVLVILFIGSYPFGRSYFHKGLNEIGFDLSRVESALGIAKYYVMINTEKSEARNGKGLKASAGALQYEKSQFVKSQAAVSERPEAPKSGFSKNLESTTSAPQGVQSEDSNLRVKKNENKPLSIETRLYKLENRWALFESKSKDTFSSDDYSQSRLRSDLLHLLAAGDLDWFDGLARRTGLIKRLERLETQWNEVLKSQNNESNHGVDLKLSADLIRLNGQIHSVQDYVSTIKPKMEDVENKTVLNTSKLVKLEERIRAINVRIPKNQAQREKATLILLGISQLSAMVSGFRPYAIQLQSLRSLLANDPRMKIYIDRLSKYESVGIPSLEKLRNEFTSAIAVALRENPEKSTLSLLSQSLSRMTDLVSIRKTKGFESASLGSAISEAEKALEEGDLYAALNAFSGLDEMEKKGFESWLRKVQSRLSADEALSALQNVVIDTLSMSDKR